MTIDLSLFKKIRCRFLDRSTGDPLPGVIASLSVGGAATNSARFPVATLCSDATGYMSFALKPLIDLGFDAAAIFISAPQLGLEDYDLVRSFHAPTYVEPASTDAIAGDGEAPEYPGATPTLPVMTNGDAPLSFVVFPIYVEKHVRQKHDVEEMTHEPTSLPSVQSPDIWDYRVSPFSFVTPPALRLGDNGCETLLPSTLPVQQYRFNRLVIRQEKTQDGAPIDAVSDTALARKVNVTGALKPRAPTIRFGEILEFQQDWYSLGHSLGEIKYSLPLAPGETIQLAVIDWSRGDRASRTDRIRATEFLDHDLRRDRAIEDTVDAALKEEQGGNSYSLGTSGTASGNTYGTGMWTGNHAIGGGASYSFGKRNLEAGALQDLHDRVRQATTSVRSLNSTVIMEASQAESNAIQTRRVANHNHCHALTIEYYEVLRQYRMTTRFAGRREAVFIPFEPFAFSASAWDLALRFRTVLEPTLIDPSLKRCFDALIRLHVAPASLYDVPTGTATLAIGPGSPEVITLEKQFEVTTDKGKGLKTGVFVELDDPIKMVTSGLLAVSGGNGYGSGGFPPEGDGKTVNNAGLPHPFLADGRKGYSLIYKIGLTGDWLQGQNGTFDTKATASGEIIFGVNTVPNGFIDMGKAEAHSWSVALRYPSHAPVISTPVKPVTDDQASEAMVEVFRKSQDELCEARLLRHLQDNQGYYNGAVWMLMDAVERRLYLEDALQGRQDILNGMDDRPLAVSGNYVAFQYNGPLADWQGTRLDDPKKPIEDIVTLPTRGLFAEAQMGHCNSCEQRDVTRNSDWTEMTTETPPDISGISPGPKGTAPSIAQGQLPANVIQINQPQAAPDPTDLANALGVLKTADIFRDMSGLDEVSKLLGELAKDATDANTKAMALKAQVEIAKIQAGGKNGAGADGNAGGTGNARSPASESDAAKQVDRLKAIEYAKSKGLTDDEGAQDAAKGVLGGEIIQASTAVDRNISTPVGIDVSYAQATIDWDRVAASNVYFAFIRTSDGMENDKYFQANWTKAHDTSLRCGAYHFWRPQFSGKKQAEVLIRQLGFLRRGDLPPVVDIEDNPLSRFTGLSVAALEKNIQEFLDTVETEFGVKPIVYTSRAFWTARMGNSTKFSGYRLWVANFEPRDDPRLPGGWATWTFWQLFDRGRVDGISTVVDTNWFNGTLESLWQLAGLNPNGQTA
jgi:GH25 family lysozyme M1 (1,4-beta-N-acetylmuramidase)